MLDLEILIKREEQWKWQIPGDGSVGQAEKSYSARIEEEIFQIFIK